MIEVSSEHTTMSLEGGKVVENNLKKLCIHCYLHLRSLSEFPQILRDATDHFHIDFITAAWLHASPSHFILRSSKWSSLVQ